MALHQSWVHGTAFAPPELPSVGVDEVDNNRWTDLTGLRQGWGTTWQGVANQSAWFHVAIPTPAIIEGARVQLNQVYVLWSAGDATAAGWSDAGALITDVHVWDGPNRIKTFGTFRVFGNHATQRDSDNTFVLPARPQISFGVGISVRAEFKNVGNQLVWFSAAGADFEI
jgi:hypothetical protein